MSFATHAPDRAPSAAIATGAPPDAGRWTGQVHRPRRRVTTLIGMPGYTVPDPKPRSTRTDPGPEGHVRRESRKARGGAGGGLAASLRPSACAYALSEPDLGWATVRVLHSRIACPGFNVSHNLERRVGKGMRNISMRRPRSALLHAGGSAGKDRRQGSPSPRHPRRSILENGGGAPQTDSYRARRHEHAHTLGTSGFNVQSHPIGRDCRPYYA